VPKWKKWQPKWVASQRKWQPKWNTEKIWVKSCPRDFKVDPAARYTGTVSSYYKWKGVGFIEVQQPDVVPGDKLFIHWSNIQTDDRFPFLVEGMEVEFGLQVWKEPRKSWQTIPSTHLRAKFVTMVGGALIAVQDEVDAKNKTFVGGQHLRYTGTLKYYDPQTGMGIAILDDGFDLEEAVPQELLVEEPEVNAGGKRPRKYLEGISVEFGIWKSKLGKFKVYNMTLPGGAIMTLENLENRQLAGKTRYQGTISQWWWKQGFGFIVPEPSTRFPAHVNAKLQKMQEAKRKWNRDSSKEPEKLVFFRGSYVQKGCHTKKGNTCSFEIYTDDKGVGATEILIM